MLIYDLKPTEEGNDRTKDVEDEIAKELESMRDHKSKLFRSIRIDTRCRKFKFEPHGNATANQLHSVL